MELLIKCLQIWRDIPWTHFAAFYYVYPQLERTSMSLPEILCCDVNCYSLAVILKIALGYQKNFTPPHDLKVSTWQRPAPRAASSSALKSASIEIGTNACIVPAKPPPCTLTAPSPLSAWRATAIATGIDCLSGLPSQYKFCR